MDTPVTSEPRNKAGIELDKFKRRLIRAVARQLLVQKKPEEEVWLDLRKEIGCDCKTLWMRMRGLTLKKLHRLFVANDCVKDIPNVARMSFTDWLLFDLVLVHQKVDVIGQEHPVQNPKHDPKPLVDLFELVKEFKIEGRRCESLAMAWSAATLKYNSQGHQCSPMLLQLRWYQLKELTRDKFYNFWYAYRGAAKRLSFAEPHTPTSLQAAIATEFKDIVTKPFMEWEQLILKRMVTLPEEFEKRMLCRSRQRMPVPNSSDDDLVVIEPQIETIDLGVESDNDDEANESSEKTESPPEFPIQIKEEPIDMDMDIEETIVEPKKSIYDVVLESTAIEQEHMDNIDEYTVQQTTDDELGNEDNLIKETIESTVKAQESVLPQITSVFGNVSSTSALTDNNPAKSKDDTPVLTNIDDHLVVNRENETHILAIAPTTVFHSVNNIPVLDGVENTLILDDKATTKVVTEENDLNVGDSDIHVEESNTTLSKTKTLRPQHIEISDSDQDPEIERNTFDSPPVSPTDNTEENCELRMEDKSDSEDNQGEAMDFDVKPNIENRAFIETFKASIVNESAVMAEDIGSSNLDEDVKPDITTFTFGELSNDINFVDDGIALMDDGIAYYDEDKHDDINNGGIPKIDPKLLMCPVIYTMKLDDMGLFRSIPFDHIEGKQLLDAIMLNSKPNKIEAKEDSSEASSDDISEDEITDDQRVKLSSYLLQKPRSRSYNPIQLCKNPDFNTRLKRLTVGFFSYPRNRGLIKSCKPLTIDLSKAFESKLISGTLYLKSSDQDIKPEIIDNTESRQCVTVVPSAMPAQSLINSKLGDILPPLQRSDISSKPPGELGSMCERSKVINLPDISEIRRINQRLLTAEVTPIQVLNSRPQVPVSIVASTHTATAQGVEVARTNVRGPPAIVDVTKDSPPKKNTETNSLTDNSSCAFETHKPARRNLQDCSFSGHNKRGCRKLGPPISWKPRQMRPDIPWLSKNTDSLTLSNKIDETLLTLDTLNKMLYLLNNDNDQPKSKQKKKKGPRTKKQDQPKTAVKEVKSVSEIQDELKESTNNISKPKINIKSADNSLPKKQKQTRLKPVDECSIAIDDQSETDAEQSEKSEDQQDDKKKEVKYCCWARQRMLQMLFARKSIPKHPCPYPLCTCCCRTLLEQYIVSDHKIKKATLKDQHGAPIVDELCENVAADNSEKAVVDHAEVSEDTAKQNVLVCSQEEIFEDTSIVETVPLEPPALFVEGLQDTTTVTDCNKSTDVDAVESPDGVPFLGGEVSITTTPVVQPVVNTPQQFKTPDIPVNISINVTGPRITTIGPRKRRANISQPPVQTSKPTLRHVLPVNKAAAPLTLRNMPPPIRKLKPVSQPKNVKEKMIFLNSKQISDNPAENPIFLGKNKILLTTVKFPPNLKKFEEVKQALKSSLKIPNGVQLVCLPNGSVTYTIDPSIMVNATDLASMPAIIARVHAEMKKTNPLAELPKAVVENEVVNLIDDDDEDKPKDNDNKNVETSEAEVPAIEEDEKESTNNSLCDGPQVETEENPDVSNNENISDNTVANIEDTNSNMFSDQNAVPIQDVQELTETERKTLSTSPEKEQPAASSTEGHEGPRSEPTTINKSKNILSDLMEMSGIFEEDITPTPEETLPVEVTEQQVVTAKSSQLLEEQPDVVTTVDVENPTPPVKKTPTMLTSKYSHQNNLPSTIKSPLGELSPITSLYELKYACLNNGIFFKLDFDTGYLIPINVCMKQQPKAIPKPIDSQSVIDLTEDDSDQTELAPTFSVKVPDKRSLLIVNNISNESRSSSNVPNPVGQQAATGIVPVKPLKLFRAAQPPIILKRINRTNTVPIATIDKLSSNETTNEKTDHKSKRKRFIRTVESINDSDTAMAKQPASKFYSKKKRKIDNVTIVIRKNKDEDKTVTPTTELPKTLTECNLEPDDSSDEEPLSNFAKRKRENEQLNKQNEEHPENQIDVQPNNQIVVQHDKQAEVQSDQQTEVQSDRQNEVDIELQAADAEDVYMSDSEPPESQTNYELILEKNMTDEAEEDQCILGV